MTDELTKVEGKQLEITESNGKTTIVFKKAILKGKVSSADVLNTILIAAKLQAEHYIKKLSHGAPLDLPEVKALKDLAEITKLEVATIDRPPTLSDTVTIDSVKSTLYTALTEKLSKPKE